MRFTPMTEEESRARQAERMLFPDGDYGYTVLEATEGIGKESGRPYIKLKLRVYVGESERICYDYLTDGAIDRLESFCTAHGMRQEYIEGTLEASDCEDREGVARFGKDKGKDGFPPKNVVKYYKSEAKTSAKSNQELEDDDVPF